MQTKKKREPQEINFSNQEKATISLEVENFFKKGTVEQVLPQKDQFMSNIFIVKKKDGCNKSVVDVKELRQYSPFVNFKMDSLKSLKTLTKSEYMCKLECPSFSGRLKESHVFVRRSSLLVSRSVFWSYTSLIFFHKTPKDPNSPLKEDRIRTEIYLDNMLIIGRTREETIALQDTVILLLQ